jgi:hypothetical protein
MEKFIVFRPGLVQGSSSGFWPDQFFVFLKNQNNVVLVKKKKTKVNGLQPGHTGFFLSLFFLQPGPVPALDQPGPELTY